MCTLLWLALERTLLCLPLERTLLCLALESEVMKIIIIYTNVFSCAVYIDDDNKYIMRFLLYVWLPDSSMRSVQLVDSSRAEFKHLLLPLLFIYLFSFLSLSSSEVAARVLLVELSPSPLSPVKGGWYHFFGPSKSSMSLIFHCPSFVLGMYGKLSLRRVRKQEEAGSVLFSTRHKFDRSFPNNKERK